jgi:Tol biopolymer transport system component
MKRLISLIIMGFLFFSTTYVNAASIPSEWINLTNNSNENDHPTWSPDGKEIVYGEWVTGQPWSLWKMKSDGTGHVLLDSHDSSDPDISPDGTKIVFQYYVGSNYHALGIINYDGTGFHHLIGGPGEGSWQMASWSPNGEEIVARRSDLNNPNDPTQIFKINSDGTNLRQLTFTGTNAYPVWSPDGLKIVYVHLDDPCCSDVWVMDADGGNQRRLTYNFGAGGTTWTPDGSKIIFASGAQPHIYIMNSDGSNILQLTDSEGSEESAEVSPDGSWLVFQGRINGIRDIYKIKLDSDGDGVPNSEDKCPNTIGEQLVYGCSCNQILDLKPGKDTATNREGCSKGIIEVFTKGIGWAKDLFG